MREQKPYRNKLFSAAIFLLIAVISPSENLAQTDDDPSFDLRLHGRINAHGDEFMTVALSPDERRLIVGTEKGEIIVWGVPERKIIRKFNQGSPIHKLVLLGDGRYVIAGGGAHIGPKDFGVVRRWDLDSGRFEEWGGLESDSVWRLAADRNAGLVAGVALNGRVAVWQAETGRLIASRDLDQAPIGLAIIGNQIYFSGVNREVVTAIEESDEALVNSIVILDAGDLQGPTRELVSTQRNCLWGELETSPDRRMIAATYLDSKKERRVAVFDAADGAERATFDGFKASWFGLNGLLILGSDRPEQMVRFGAVGAGAVQKFPEGGGWHSDRAPAGLNEAVTSRDGSTVWGVFSNGAAIVRWKPKKRLVKILSMTVGNVYAMDALDEPDQPALLLTGGADGFARVWNLNDLSLLREFSVPFGVPQGVGLLKGGRQAVVSYSSKESPTEIALLDIATGERKVLLKLDQPYVRVYAAGDDFVFGQESRVALASAFDGVTLREFAIGKKLSQFCVSSNGSWLGMADSEGKLYVFEIATGRLVCSSAEKDDTLTQLAVSDDGRFIYTIGFIGGLNRWDAQNDRFEELNDIRRQCLELRLSVDQNRILIVENHRDLAIYDAKTGKQIAYFETEAADSNVTNVWAKGARVIYTTGTGVMFDGRLESSRRGGK